MGVVYIPELSGIGGTWTLGDPLWFLGAPRIAWRSSQIRAFGGCSRALFASLEGRETQFTWKGFVAQMSWCVGRGENFDAS